MSVLYDGRSERARCPIDLLLLLRSDLPRAHVAHERELFLLLTGILSTAGGLPALTESRHGTVARQMAQLQFGDAVDVELAGPAQCLSQTPPDLVPSDVAPTQVTADARSIARRRRLQITTLQSARPAVE